MNVLLIVCDCSSRSKNTVCLPISLGRRLADEVKSLFGRFYVESDDFLTQDVEV